METLNLAKYIPKDYEEYENINPYTVPYDDEELPYIYNDLSSDKIPANISESVNKDKKIAGNDDYIKFYEDFNKVVENSSGKLRFQSSPDVSSNVDFDKAYDEYEKKNPSSRKYRKFLKKVAYYESRFNSKAKNKNAPAYGWFQFMQDGNRYNNISSYTGLDINSFINNPVAQIEGANRMIMDIERQLTASDRNRMKELGITDEGALGLAWLGGVGGLRRFIHKGINASDSSWYKNGSGGVDMKEQLKRYN